MNLTDKEHKVLAALFARYMNMIYSNWDSLFSEFDKCGPDDLYILCNEVVVNGKLYPADKMHRWLGFVQGILCVKGITNVDEEREFSRPLLHSLHDGTIPTYPRNE